MGTEKGGGRDWVEKREGRGNCGQDVKRINK